MKRLVLVVLMVALTAFLVACGGAAPTVEQVAPTVQAVVEQVAPTVAAVATD